MTPSRLEDALVTMRRIMRATELSSLALAKKSGLTPSQLIVLQLIANESQPTPSLVSARTTLSQATITTVLHKLEARQLITRQRDDKDKRRQYLQVTTLGAETLEAAPDILQAQFQIQFQKLEDWEQSLLVSSLQRVAKLLGADQIDAAPILDLGELNAPIMDE